MQEAFTDRRARATLLAALRYWQREGLMSGGHEQDIASDGGNVKPMTAEEIERLCEMLQPSTVEQPTISQRHYVARVDFDDETDMAYAVIAPSETEARKVLECVAAHAVDDSCYAGDHVWAGRGDRRAWGTHVEEITKHVFDVLNRFMETMSVSAEDLARMESLCAEYARRKSADRLAWTQELLAACEEAIAAQRRLIEHEGVLEAHALSLRTLQAEKARLETEIAVLTAAPQVE